ncbi:MAG: extracellular solute-binding protein [Clostridia bacterium]|nr:extracellular solute-binding protein [Clostridia bacterium]MBQ9289217.1 extracellular solute-binding protein [Clostridia bacterium]
MTRKILALVLASLMLLALIPAASAETAAQWEPFAENVSITIPVYDRGQAGVPNVESNTWTQWIQENFGNKYNITVNYVAIPRTDVMTKYSLLAAGEQLPTVLMEYDYPKVTQWAADGYLTTFNMDDFAAVAPTYYQRMVDNNQLTYTQINGETYFVAAYRPYYDTSYTFQSFVRMDWLKQVGYDHVPATQAEYLDAMRKIKEAGIAEHPCGGVMITGVGSDQNYSYREWPLNEEEWAKYGDYNIPSLGWTPNYKLLKYENMKYNEGLTNPEYYLLSGEDDKSAFINGETYQYGGYISAAMDWLTAFYEANPDAELAIVPVNGKVDAEAGTTPGYRTDNPFGMMVGFSKDATPDQLKAAWMYMEWLTQPENLFTFQWGFEGDNFNYVDGLPVSVSDYKGEHTMGFNNNKDYWCITLEARQAGTIEDVISNNLPHDLPQDFTQDVIGWYYDKCKVRDAGWAIANALYSVSMEAEAEYQTTLVNLYKEYRDKLTMCPADQFDALYQEYAQAYLDAGYQEVIDERAAAYAAGNSTHLLNQTAEEVDLSK